MLYSPEDVIVYKLKYYVLGRIPKHLRDIGAIMTAKGDALDRAFIAGWAGRVERVMCGPDLAAYDSAQP